jgi:hypothetical protein
VFGPDDLNTFGQMADMLDPQPDPFLEKPKAWIEQRLGEHIWSGQERIMNSVLANKKTAVPSAHSTGKSHIAARVIAHWIATHPIDETFVVSTAPSTPQVKAILWRYLKSIRRKAGLPGYITESEIPEWKIDGRLVAWGRKPADLTNAEEAATAFQGQHAKYLLVVIDEAGGIPSWLWTAIETIATQPTNRILAIGNPDDPTSHFEKICRPGSGWNVEKISAYDTPAFTGEKVPEEISDNLVGEDWVEDMKKAWGEDSPLFISKIKAEFPDTSEDNLIPIKLINAAIERDFSGEAVADHGKFSLDVARQGRDSSCLGFWRAGQFRIIKSVVGIGNTMKLVGWMSTLCRKKPAIRGIVDADGLGGPVFDRARELHLPVSAFYAQRKAFNPKKFVNRRSEQWWGLRQLFEAGLVDIDPKDEELQSQLASIKYEEDSAGRIAVETKKEMKKRGLPSPDRADTLMMVTAPMDDWTGMYTPAPDPGVEQEPETLTGDLLTKEW